MKKICSNGATRLVELYPAVSAQLVNALFLVIICLLSSKNKIYYSTAQYKIN